MTARQFVELAAVLTCAAVSTCAAVVAAVLTPADDPRDTEEDQ